MLMACLVTVREEKNKHFKAQSLCYNSLVDIAECVLQPNICDQICHDSIGSFSCSCRTGYVLNQDGRTCDGKIIH